MSSRADNIFRRYSAALYGFIKKRLSSDSEESEDILQDIFYRFIVADGEDEQIENVSSWLYRVARNLIIDRSRKIKEREMPYVKDDESVEIPISELFLYDNNTPENELARAIFQEEFEIALSQLPENQRRVYELNELQGISFAEISEATNTPINTLISRKRYAVESLRKKLGYFLE
ncbi:MAG: sigma-70 family RNA polymerase sigma factor [Rikenellaceae bacterium]